MFERISLSLGRLIMALKREDGQGMTEYAMVLGFIVVTLTITLGALGTSIDDFLGRVGGKIDGLVP